MTRSPQNRKNPRALRLQDPYLERERAKYSQPLPSREFILQLIDAAGVPLTVPELIKMLAINDAESAFFTHRLRAMERAGQLIINRKGALCVADKLNLIQGVVLGHRDGYGFVRPDEGSPDIFLGEREMSKVFHGDRVMVREKGRDRKGRLEGKIVEVLSRQHKTLIGRVVDERGIFFVVPEEKRIAQDILIEPGYLNHAQHGDIVVIEIVVYPDIHRQPMGRVREIIGDMRDEGIEIEIALRHHALPYQFDRITQDAALRVPQHVRPVDYADRVDLRDVPFVTIDGETAKDFDDAVYAEKLGKGWRLLVAIADVSHYVRPNDPLDLEAQRRGNSVYFPRRVIPMLPEALSNGICSLNPQVERLCLVCDMTVGAKGALKAYQFYPAVMQSRARLTYAHVWQVLQQKNGGELQPHLESLYAVFKAFLSARRKRGAIELDTVETQMIFREDGKIERIEPVVRNDAHRLIEECMLAANVCAAHFLTKKKHPMLYRVHEGPTPEKLQTLRAFLGGLGLHLHGEDTPTPKDYAQLTTQIQSRDDVSVIQTMLLRSLQQAAYTTENKGHFGLSYPAYTHFTSPIRRYPDLLIHRSIKALLQQEQYTPQTTWSALGTHCSMTERRADDATRDVESWLKTQFMQQHLGEVFCGKICAVTAFGFFVLLDDVYTEGLVHVSELGRDYFNYDPRRQALIGERSGLIYRLGDSIAVKVVRVDVEQRKIDFSLVTLDAGVKNPQKHQKKTPAPLKKRKKQAIDYKKQK